MIQVRPTSRIAIDQERIDAFCERHHLVRSSLFGSVLRDGFGPESDVDVLVEFEPGRTPGLAFFGLRDGLSEIAGRRIDPNTRGCLSKDFRDQVEAAARPISVRAR